MSVETENDRLLQEAKENIQNAIERLGEVIIFRGSDEFTKTYRDKMGNALKSLISARDELNG